jgi:hypothetical protein
MNASSDAAHLREAWGVTQRTLIALGPVRPLAVSAGAAENQHDTRRAGRSAPSDRDDEFASR